MISSTSCREPPTFAHHEHARHNPIPICVGRRRQLVRPKNKAIELAVLRHTKTRACLIRVCSRAIVTAAASPANATNLDGCGPAGLLVAHLYLPAAINHLVCRTDRRQWHLPVVQVRSHIPAIRYSTCIHILIKTYTRL